MKNYSLTHLSDESLRRELSAAAANEKHATADLVAHIAEFDERKLYLPAAYPNMFAYCVGELHFSEDAAAKRIQVARAAQRCPEILDALAGGRVHLSGLVLLAPHLNSGSTAELLSAATHKSKSEIERLLAARVPKPLVPPGVVALLPVADSHAPGHVNLQKAPEAQVAPPSLDPTAKVAPLSAEAFAVQFTRSREQDERFRYLQDLLGHQVARGDLAEVYDRAVKELIGRLERTRFAATPRPARPHRTAAGSRHIPAHVKRAVWQRDAGQCTFVSEAGRRCEARRGLEFDHVREYARGGEATVDGIRLRCRGHNQFTAERTFGEGFMRHKREVAASARATKNRAARDNGAVGTAGGHQQVRRDDDVFLALQTLGYRAAESRRAMALCVDLSGASPEEKLCRALTYFPQRCHRVERFAEASSVSTPAPV